MSRVALLFNPNEPPARGYIVEGEAAAANLGLTQQIFEARSLDELEPTFDAIARAGMRADQKRSFTLAGDELRYTNPVASIGQGVVVEAVWKRAK